MKIINKTIYSSKGKLTKPQGAVIHNDGGSINATPEFYVSWLPTHNPEAGFAHYYINKDTNFRAMDTYSITWHCGNSWGNANLLSYEVCQSGGYGITGASDKDFLANEEATFKQVAEDFKYYGLKPSRDTVFLHRSLSSTDCPWRSWQLHVGKGAANTKANRNKLVDYFVSRIKHYMDGSGSSKPSATTNKAITKKPASNSKPLTNGKVGDKVKVVDALYVSSDGTGRSTAKKGKTGTIKKVVSSGKRYLVEDWGWGHANDLQLVTSAAKPKPTTTKKPASNGGWIAEKGTFTLSKAIYLRTSASSNGGSLGLIGVGQKIEYNAFKHSGGYVWIRQPRANGKYGYMATGESKNGKRVSKWGTFK